MPELRRNLISGDWVIIATERAKRPEDFKKKAGDKKVFLEFSEKCPFCPGNENQTPPADLVINKGEKWQIRTCLNKFAALSSKGELNRKCEGIWHSLQGIGRHEVIIETPKHNLTTALLEVEEIKLILNAYQARYLEIQKNKNIEMIIIFKNHGESAGTSLEHPHSQLIATPVVSSHIRHRLQEAIRFKDETGDCVFCKTMLEELKNGERVILENKYFVTFIPYAAYSPFHIWVFPKRHYSSFAEILEEEKISLAETLKIVLNKIYVKLDNPDYNYIICSSPLGIGEVDYFHWYLSIIPRITKAAGFELGSGMYINSALPEASAKFLREE